MALFTLKTFVSLRQIVPAILLILTCSMSVSVHANNGDVTVVKHYDKGYSPLLRVYLTDVLKMVLDKTTSEYGPYKLEFYSRFLSSNRSKLETERGVLIDILFSSHWRGNFVNQNKVIQLEYPVFYGMLGLRNLIVTSDGEQTLASLDNVDGFKQLVAGQGSNWVDVEILTSNDIPVIEAQLFDALFPMLDKNRFDYLPLSILEAQTALHTKGVQYNRLFINRDVAIFYPLPFYLFVNSEKPELAKRLAKGLQRAQYDGSLERLFRKHFSYVEPLLEESTKKLLIYKSPLLSDEKNQEYIELFLDKYQNYFQPLNY